MVGGDDDVGIGLGKFLEKFADRRVVEPRSGDAAVGTLIARQFTHHARLRTGMTEHIDEVDDQHIKIVAHKVLETFHYFLRLRRVVQLEVGESILATIAVE